MCGVEKIAHCHHLARQTIALRKFLRSRPPSKAPAGCGYSGVNKQCADLYIIPLNETGFKHSRCTKGLCLSSEMIGLLQGGQGECLEGDAVISGQSAPTTWLASIPAGFQGCPARLRQSCQMAQGGAISPCDPGDCPALLLSGGGARATARPGRLAGRADRRRFRWC